MADTLGACVVGTGNESSALTDLVVKRRNEGKSWQSIADEAHAQGLIPKANPNRVKRIHEKWIKSGAKSLVSADVKPATVAKVLDPPIPVGQKIAQGIPPSTISKEIPIPAKQIGEVAAHNLDTMGLEKATSFEDFVAKGMAAGKGYKTIAEEAVKAGWIPKVNPNRVKRAAQKLGLSPTGAHGAASALGGSHGVLPTSTWIPEAPRGIQTRIKEWYNEGFYSAQAQKDGIAKAISRRFDADAEELIDFFDTLRHTRDLESRDGFLDAWKKGYLYISDAGYRGVQLHIVPPGAAIPPGARLMQRGADVDLIKTSISNHLVGTWAATSSNNHVIALAIQDAARAEFGLTRAINRIPDELVTDVAQVLNMHGDTLQRYLRAMYENTQEAFKAAGITHVHVYRHMRFTETIYDAGKSVNNPSFPPWAKAAKDAKKAPQELSLGSVMPSFEGTEAEPFLKWLQGKYGAQYQVASLASTSKKTYLFRNYFRQFQQATGSTAEATQVHKAIVKVVKPLKASGSVVRDDVVLQPISSFGITAQKSFGPYQVRATVSVDRILGTARTGYGCYNEKEFVLMDTPGEMVVTYSGSGW